MKNYLAPLPIAILLLAILGPAGQVHSESILYFTSSSTSWIGHGLTVTAPITSAYRYYDLGAYTNALDFSANGWDLTLVGPNYSLLAVGSYPNATRQPFQENGPGLCLSGYGRCDNELTGHFEVLEATYEPDGKIKSFAANFMQYDEGKAAWWNSGYVHYNYTVPEPSGIVLLGIGGSGLIGFAWRRRS